MLCKNSSDLKAIQEIFGHKDISTTLNTYADATKEGINKSMQAMQGVISVTTDYPLCDFFHESSCDI